jgi:hypothetical protein
LKRDGPDLRPDGCGHRISRNVGLLRDRPQDRQSLGGDLNAARTKKVGRGHCHPYTVDQILDQFQ